MTDISASSIKGMPGWQLLAEFTVAGVPGSNRQRLNQVMDALQGVNLQPVQLEGIQRAFVQAVAKASCCEEPAAIYRLRIRIWVLGACASSHGWGFFVVEKGDNPQRVRTDTDHLVELFLYQECDGRCVWRDV
jgi:hypothetical protein